MQKNFIFFYKELLQYFDYTVIYNYKARETQALLVRATNLCYKGEDMKRWMKKILRKALELLIAGIIQILVAYVIFIITR